MINAQDQPEEFSIFGFKYARLILDKFNGEALEELKKKYSYAHISSFVDFDMPGFERVPKKTPIINLAQSAEEIFSKFDETARKHVRRALRNKDLRIAVLDQNIDGAYSLYKHVKKSEGAMPDIKREFANCLIFNGYFKNKIIVTASFYKSGKYLRAKHIASLRKEMREENKIAAQALRLITYEVCKWGHENGYELLDLGIINFSESEKGGIASFKQSFGGDIVDVYIFRYETMIFKIIRKILNIFGRNIS